jgi:hypothetical protein
MIINITKLDGMNKKQYRQEDVKQKMERKSDEDQKIKLMYDQYFCKSNYLLKQWKKSLKATFLSFKRKACGGGGSEVFKSTHMDHLYLSYDQTGSKRSHLDALENYDNFVGDWHSPQVFLWISA